ncbi:MAG TPA: pirin family protein [Planctomycetota bacterium]|nr:pirin family protein [Planctomycetota bacterium]
MKTLRRADERGGGDHGWLKTRHTFSFADYHDPAHMGFANLRVINEDVVAPGQGFGFHPHRDMEIVTYPLAGSLKHRDSLGNEGVLRRGDVQRMSAGTGIVHSETNASDREPLHLLQIWILPTHRGTPPSYEDRTFDPAARRNVWKPLVSRGGGDGALTIGADVRLDAVLLDAGASVATPLNRTRPYWLHVAAGSVTVDGDPLSAGDAVGIRDLDGLSIVAAAEADLLLFALRDP